jgi:hypothetical protein
LTNVVRRRLLLQQRRLGDQDGERVVELVRHAREQRAHGGELLDLMDARPLLLDLGLRPAAVAQIAQVSGEEMPVGQLDLVDRHLDGDQLAGDRQRLELHALAHDAGDAGGHVARHAGLVRGPVVVRNDEVRQRLADGVLAPVAEHLLGGRVEVADQALAVGEHEGVARAAHDLGVHLLRRLPLGLGSRQVGEARTQLLLPQLEVAQIAREDEDRLDGAAARRVGRHRDLQVALPAAREGDPSVPARRVHGRHPPRGLGECDVDLGSQHVLGAPADQVVERQADEAQELGVGVEVAVVRRHQRDARGRGVHHRAQHGDVGLVQALRPAGDRSRHCVFLPSVVLRSGCGRCPFAARETTPRQPAAARGGA